MRGHHSKEITRDLPEESTMLQTAGVHQEMRTRKKAHRPLLPAGLEEEAGQLVEGGYSQGLEGCNDLSGWVSEQVTD